MTEKMLGDSFAPGLAKEFFKKEKRNIGKMKERKREK